MAKQSGKVKFFNEAKAFGFISPDGGGKDVFVHKSELAPGVSITEGSKVRFDTKSDPRGTKAVSVELA